MKTEAHKVKARERVRKWRAENPDVYKETHQKWIADNPDVVRAYQRKHNLKRKYDLTIDQYNAML